MADTKDTGQSKTLEMRVAELEDKLAQLHVSEEEMKTYQKVASKLGTGACQQCTASPCVAAQAPPCIAAQQAQAQAQQPCVAAQQAAQQPCIASSASISPIYYRCYYYRCYYFNCYYYNDCILATQPTGGPVAGGGGFGGFGT